MTSIARGNICPALPMQANRQPRPLFLGGLVQLIGADDPQRSDTTLLAASLFTLGIPRAGEEYFSCTCERLNGSLDWHCIWHLRDESRDGRFDTGKMIAGWNSGTWLLANPTHPLAILRNGLTFPRAFTYTPRFTLAERTHLETPDTWMETGIYNLIYLLRDMPRGRQSARAIARFGPRWNAGVPLNLAESDKTRFLKYVEHRDHPAKRAQIRAA
jgi:hypothetical protein